MSSFSSEEWCSDANNWDNFEQSDSSLASLYVDEAASLINCISIDEENANEVPDVAFIETKNGIATAEIEPDENEPITVDSPVIPNCNLISLLKQKPSLPKVSSSIIIVKVSKNHVDYRVIGGTPFSFILYSE